MLLLNKVTDFLTIQFLNIFKRNVMLSKILQMMGGLENMSEELQKKISKSMNSVDYTEDEINYTKLLYIVNEYNIKLDNIRPTNSGMISLIYKGTDNSGNKIIIKLKRLNIEEKIKKDYRFFNRIMNVLYYISFINYNMRTVIYGLKSLIDTEEYILSQCDLYQEINTMMGIKPTMDKYTTNITIPHCYNKSEDMTRDINFIVMDLMSGCNCLTIQDEYKEELFRLIHIFTTVATIFAQMAHTDLHPGNILYEIKDGTVHLSVIDFGMNIHYSPFLAGLLKIMIETVMSGKACNLKLDDNLLSLVNGMFNESISFDKLSQIQKQQSLSSVNYFIDICVANDVNEKIINILCDKLKKTLNLSNLSMSLEFIKISLSLSMYSSTARILVPDKKKAAIIMKKAITEVYLY
jgi:predicted unusual protein kinase regulating ubiquinone biosynthesis (AarF/ABC1/UbiB family)